MWRASFKLYLMKPTRKARWQAAAIFLASVSVARADGMAEAAAAAQELSENLAPGAAIMVAVGAVFVGFILACRMLKNM